MSIIVDEESQEATAEELTPKKVDCQILMQKSLLKKAVQEFEKINPILEK
jgi:hypothetical protein